MRFFAALLFLPALSVACSANLPQRACAPGATRACACASGRSGAQVCEDDGSRFGECTCSGAFVAGGADTGPMSAPDSGPDEVPDAGPRDTGRWDSGIWGCGDGICATSESCGSCESDCGECPVACTSCESDVNACPSGTTCRWRLCDGALGCFADVEAPICDTIDGFACPASRVYDTAASQAECGPHASWNGSRCWPSCGQVAGPRGRYCPPPPSSSTGVTASCQNTGCEQGSHGGVGSCNYRCALECTAGARCPFGMSCVSGECR